MFSFNLIRVTLCCQHFVLTSHKIGILSFMYVMAHNSQTEQNKFIQKIITEKNSEIRSGKKTDITTQMATVSVSAMRNELSHSQKGKKRRIR